MAAKYFLRKLGCKLTKTEQIDEMKRQSLEMTDDTHMKTLHFG